MTYRAMTEDEIKERFLETVAGVAEAILDMLGPEARETEFHHRFAVYENTVENRIDGTWMHQRTFPLVPLVVEQAEKAGFHGSVAEKVADSLIKGLLSEDISIPGFFSPMGGNNMRFYERIR